MRIEFFNEDRAEASAYRYDYGQMLEIAGLELSDGFEVHFQNGTGSPEIRQGTVRNDIGIVAVPDVTLSLEYDYVKAWIYVKMPESGTTIKTIVINILPREKPSDAPSVDDYPQIKRYADYVRENAERVSAAEAVADKLKADAAAGLFNGRDGASGERGEKGDKGDPGTTDYRELTNNPFQPVPEPSDPTEALRIPQDLEPGAYVFTSGDLNVDFCGGIIHPSEGELLYITCPYPFKHNQAVFFNSKGVTFTVGSEQNGEYFYDSKTVNADTINNIELLYQMMDLISTWLVPLFNVSPGQAVTVENADMAEMSLVMTGMDLPSTLPSPNALTIKIGSEAVVYDGSTAQTVEIADGNEVAY